MKTLLYAGGGLAGTLALLWAVAYLLPGAYEVRRQVSIRAPADVVFQYVGDLRAWPSWTVWTARDPAMRHEFTGDTRAVGGAWTWNSETEGAGRLTLAELTRPERLGYRLAFEGVGMESRGSIVVHRAGEGLVVVTWTNAGDLGWNPVYRYLGLFLDGMLGPDFEAGLQKLKALAEAAAAAESPEAATAPAA